MWRFVLVVANSEWKKIADSTGLSNMSRVASSSELRTRCSALDEAKNNSTAGVIHPNDTDIESSDATARISNDSAEEAIDEKDVSSYLGAATGVQLIMIL